MQEEYRGIIIEIYPSHEVYNPSGEDEYYWAVFADGEYLGDRFSTIDAARFAAIQYIELARLWGVGDGIE